MMSVRQRHLLKSSSSQTLIALFNAIPADQRPSSFTPLDLEGVNPGRFDDYWKVHHCLLVGFLIQFLRTAAGWGSWLRLKWLAPYYTVPKKHTFLSLRQDLVDVLNEDCKNSDGLRSRQSQTMQTISGRKISESSEVLNLTHFRGVISVFI